MEDPGPYLFRGTSRGFPGTTFSRIGLTPLTTDPVVATLFAIHCCEHGEGVVHIVATDRLRDRLHLRPRRDTLQELEREVMVELHANEVAARGMTLPVEQAREILENMNVRLPRRIDLARLSEALRFTPRLTTEQVIEFVRRADGGPP